MSINKRVMLLYYGGLKGYLAKQILKALRTNYQPKINQQLTDGSYHRIKVVEPDSTLRQ